MRKICLFLILMYACNKQAFTQIISVFNTAGSSGNILIGQSNYHASESIYTTSELGDANFTSQNDKIEKVNFIINTSGPTTLISNFRIWMMNISSSTNTLASGTYSTAGYTLVFNGSFDAVQGLAGVTLSTPFQRLAGSNLRVLIERLDNQLYTGNVVNAAVGNTINGVENSSALSSRRYNGVSAPTGATILTETSFRPAMQFVHTFSINAKLAGISLRNSCFSSNESVTVEVYNQGTDIIEAGVASINLQVAGANSFNGSQINSNDIPPGGTTSITINNVNLSNIGANNFLAVVKLVNDPDANNDSLRNNNITASILSGFPLLEDFEESLPVVPFTETIDISQRWKLQTGDYSNLDQPIPLSPHSGAKMYLFDSYNDQSQMAQSRLYSNCIDLSGRFSASLAFWMSHDNLFPIFYDSLYVSVSTDKGVSWVRIAGFQRNDATFTGWRMEEINLQEYLQQIIQIGFEGVSKWGNSFAIDDISISANGPPVYTFTGDGNWDDPANWENNMIPPSNFLNGDIYINPIDGGECILNVPQSISGPATLVVKAGKKFRINGKLTVY